MVEGVRGEGGQKQGSPSSRVSAATPASTSPATPRASQPPHAAAPAVGVATTARPSPCARPPRVKSLTGGISQLNACIDAVHSEVPEGCIDHYSSRLTIVGPVVESTARRPGRSSAARSLRAERERASHLFTASRVNETLFTLAASGSPISSPDGIISFATLKRFERKKENGKAREGWEGKRKKENRQPKGGMGGINK